MTRLFAAVVAALVLAVTAPALAASPSSPRGLGPPGDLVADDVSFRGGGGLVLHGSVISPRGGSAGRPGLVLVHGAGTGTPREKLMAEAVAFARQGLTVLVYDKRSEGYSFFERSYADLAEDALGAVGVLRRQPGVDPAKVGIWGFSEGGWVAPIAAAKSSDVSFLILVGANGLQPLRQQVWAVASGLRKAGVGGPLVDLTVPKLYRVVADGGMFPEPYFDPAPVVGRVRQPVLGVWGVHDLLTPPRESPPLLAAALEAGGNGHYTFRFFPDADHAAHLTPDGGVTRLPELAPGYAELVGDWVTDVTSGRPPATQVSGPAPVQPEDTTPVPPPAWWESAWAQLAALVLFLVAFGGYPVTALVRRMRGRRPSTAPARAARVVSAGGLVTIFGAFAFLVHQVMTGGKLAAPGPVVVDRPLVWLALQALAAVTVVATVLTAARWRRSIPVGEKVRLGLLIGGGVAFVPWALSWGLLLP
ncbi:alpha/beta hydrolase family protein [Nonomuraea aridisoli]|uniref:Alpha/beta hydrolase n=1 Tax=Nonomuraea aridisoli TaxID=2070368 RepID=A0A2W2EMU2_9ACTN|nr:alpha/beta hydrolase [Nonomuraea aridisoli]PZG17915.1 alpha/beta hydrolase [Nonomuraea aridisoli]